MLPQIFQKLSIWIIVIPFLTGILNYKGLDRDSRWIFLLVLLAMPPQILTAIYDRETAFLNLTYNAYIPVEFCILYAIFFPKYNSRRSRLLIRISAGIFALACTGFFIGMGMRQRFLSELLCVGNVLYMLWILLLLKQEYAAEETIIVPGNPFTWYLIATILYAPSTVASFALYYYIRDPANPVRINLTILHSIFNIVLYLLYAAGLVIRRSNKWKDILNIL